MADKHEIPLDQFVDEDPDDIGAECWACHGEGGFHDCGEDCCCCLDKDEITETCEECGGSGVLR